MDRIKNARTNLADMTWYCDSFLSVIVGKKNYNQRKYQEVASSIVTRSDEAFLLVIIENSIDRWTAKVSDPGKKEGDWPEPKYTSNANDNKKYLGWSTAGINCYNNYMTVIVPKTRDASKEMEVQLREQYRNETARKRPSQYSNVVALLQSDTEEEEEE